MANTFSNLLDISSFFIGILINLLLVALICYYFKRKIDNLELSQSEQAKMLYTLIKEKQEKSLSELQNTQNSPLGFINNLDLSALNNITENDGNMEESVNDDDDDDESVNSDDSDNSDDDSDTTVSELEYDNNSENEIKTFEITKVDNDVEVTPEVEVVEDMVEEVVEEVVEKVTGDIAEEVEMKNLEEVKQIVINNQEDLINYEKMTLKELKSIVESKQIEGYKKNMKKNELIDLIKSIDNNEEILINNDELIINEIEDINEIN